MKGKDWKQKIDKWKTTHISMAAYCRQNDLSYWTFRSWRKKLEGSSTTLNSPGFVKITRPYLTMNTETTTSIEIHLRRAKTKIPSNFEKQQLYRILSVLQKTDIV